MLTGSIFNSSTPNKSTNSSYYNNNTQSLRNSTTRKAYTGPVSRGEQSNIGSNSTSRGMSFMVGSEGNISEMEKYDNYMMNVTNDLFI